MCSRRLPVVPRNETNSFVLLQCAWENAVAIRKHKATGDQASDPEKSGKSFGNGCPKTGRLYSCHSRFFYEKSDEGIEKYGI